SGPTALSRPAALPIWGHAPVLHAERGGAVELPGRVVALQAAGIVSWPVEPAPEDGGYGLHGADDGPPGAAAQARVPAVRRQSPRSEEHTSELQSRDNH